MSDGFSAVAACLERAGVAPDPLDIADILWLGQKIRKACPGTGRALVPPDPLPIDDVAYRDDVEYRDRHRPLQVAPAEPLAPFVPKEPPDILLPSRDSPAIHPNPTLVDDPSQEPRPLPKSEARVTFPGRVSLPSPLPHSLEIARGFAPLKRRVPSRVERALDVAATVDCYARTDVWMPRFRSRTERWLDLALVVDGGDSMKVWGPQIAALGRLLANHGAFRDVRRWRIARVGGAAPDQAGSPRLLSHDGRSAAPEQLLHPQGRRLVLIVSDLADRAWDEGIFNRWLGLWGRRQPVGLLHPLPERYWDRGGLCRAPFADLYAKVPGIPNAQLRIEPDPAQWDGADAPKRRWMALPMLSLEPGPLRRWGHFVSGLGAAPGFGACIDVDLKPGPAGPRWEPKAAHPHLNEDEVRLAAFYGFASAPARRLARMCSLFPLTLPIIRTVQSELVPEAGISDLAEFVTSGLLRCADPSAPDPGREQHATATADLRQSRAPASEPKPICYEYRGCLRARLAAPIRPAEVYRRRRRVGHALQLHWGNSPEWIAYFPDLAEPADLRCLTQRDALARQQLDFVRNFVGFPPGREQEIARRLAPPEPDLPRDPQPFVDPIPGTPFDGPQLVWLPGGSFLMGSDSSEIPDAAPAHRQQVGHFAIGVHPVTCGQYDAFCCRTGRTRLAHDDRWRPAVGVSWQDAADFCRWLTGLTGRTYRLCTEAEWEYACRAGESWAFSHGNSQERLPRFALFGDHWLPQGLRVRLRDPNRWGLFDMHGCVWEWTRDAFAPYGADGASPASGDSPGPERVVRGGCWSSEAIECASAYRRRVAADHRDDVTGFRVVRVGDAASYPFLVPAPEASAIEGNDREAHPWTGLRERLPDGSLGPAMTWLPRRGAPDPGAWEAHGAMGTEVLAVGQTPVTFDEYDLFWQQARKDPGHRPPHDGAGRGERPVTSVSFAQACDYCAWLSRETGATYRLPTDLEWVNACRAGAATADGPAASWLREHAWFDDNAARHTSPVRLKEANAFGLYDMLGNVWEWIGEGEDDPARPPRYRASRHARGGAFDSPAADCDPSAMRSLEAGVRARNLGFRIVRRGRWPLSAMGAAHQIEPGAVREAKRFRLPRAADRALPELMEIPSGVFVMGDSRDQGDRRERPDRLVALTRFQIGVFPVTVREYLDFVAAVGNCPPVWLADGSPYHSEHGTLDLYRRCGVTRDAEDLPIVGIGFTDAQAYCHWLSQRSGRHFALPSEAQWEYACRAGSTRAYCFGDDERELSRFGWYAGNAHGRVAPVGQRDPNDWGLHDMHGGVQEWTCDYLDDYPPPTAPVVRDPRGPATGRLIAIRGGSWLSRAHNCRCAGRLGRDPGPQGRGHDLGLRVVCLD